MYKNAILCTKLLNPINIRSVILPVDDAIHVSSLLEKRKKQATYFETISKAHNSLKAKYIHNDINIHKLQIHNTLKKIYFNIPIY
jgi:hypothetical protein